MRRKVLAALLVVVGSGAAYADFQYAATATQTNLINATLTSGAVGNLVGGPDGTTVTYTATAANAEVQFRFDFAQPINATSTGSPSFVLYGLSISGAATVLHVVWSVDTANAGDPIIFGLNRSISSGAVVPVLLSPDQFSPAFSGATAYQSLFVNFKLVSSGDTITLDAVSNPEPGTWALFGCAALGLAGWTWRRKRREAAGEAARRVAVQPFLQPPA